MRSLIYIFVIFMFISCEKEQVISDIPEIGFVSITPNEVQEYSEEINITISYVDDNGDLGENNPDVKNMFVKDLRNGIEYEYRIPQLSPDNSEIQISGNLVIVINGTGITNGNTSEKVSYEIYVMDRASNISNVIETSEITINQ